MQNVPSLKPLRTQKYIERALNLAYLQKLRMLCQGKAENLDHSAAQV